MPNWTDILNFAEKTTIRVGQQLLADFGKAQASEKADGSLVTQSDQWADGELRAAIADRFPKHGVLSEEGAHIFPANDWCWIIDPIDGTTNFTRGIPIWGISLGLLYQGTPVFGYVDFPPLRQTFHGFWRGDSGLSGPTGAFMNHQSIHVSRETPSNNHFFSLCARSTDILKQPFPCKIRMLGVATYNLLTVATGTSLGAVEATPKIWDIAAVWAIVQAAGAAWTPLENQPIFPLKIQADYSLRPFPTLVTSRLELTDQFKPLVEGVVK